MPSLEDYRLVLFDGSVVFYLSYLLCLYGLLMPSLEDIDLLFLAL